MKRFYTPPQDEADLDEPDYLDRWYNFGTDPYWLGWYAKILGAPCEFILTITSACWIWNGCLEAAGAGPSERAYARGPLLINADRLLQRKTEFPYSDTEVWLDSRGYHELLRHGRWTITPRRYADLAVRVAERFDLRAAVTQDYMCEPWALAKTGLTVDEHQRRTIESLFELHNLEPAIPWMPVLQGQMLDDFLRHIEMYEEAGVNLSAFERVGLGTVCRRHATEEISKIISEISARAIRLHAFGVKTEGLRRNAGSLSSTDSNAWSYNGRKLSRLGARDSKGYWLQNSPERAREFQEAMRLIAARNTDAPSQVEIIPSSAIEYTDRDPKPIPRARALSEVVDGAIVGLQLHMFQGTPE